MSEMFHFSCPDPKAVRRISPLVSEGFDLDEGTTLSAAKLRCHELRVPARRDSDYGAKFRGVVAALADRQFSEQY